MKLSVNMGDKWILVDTDENGLTSNLHVSELMASDLEYNAAIDGLESLVLAHACEGIDVTSVAYVKGIRTALDNIGNNC